MNLFVYGTLMRGCGNDHLINENLVSSISEARVRGRMFVGSERSRFPYLQIPLSDMHRHGVSSVVDALSWDKLQSYTGYKRGRPQIFEDDMTPIDGELIRFEGPGELLSDQLFRLDALEGFDATDPNCHYLRILTHASLGKGKSELCWIYVLPHLLPSAPNELLQVKTGSWRKFVEERT